MTDLKNLFQSSRDDGNLSEDSLQILTLPDLGAKIQQGLGIAVDNVPASEVFLLTLLVDDSGSIRSAGNEQLVRDGYNAILTALKDSKQESGILVHTRYLNGLVLTPYTPIADSNTAMTAKIPSSCTLKRGAIEEIASSIVRTFEMGCSGSTVRIAF